MNKNEFEKLKENYPQVYPFILPVKSSANKKESILFYTAKIEKEHDFKKLCSWVNYWASDNPLLAILIVTKLKYVSLEEKEKLKKLPSKIKNMKMQNNPKSIQEKIYYYLLTYLFFEDYDMVFKIYLAISFNALVEDIHELSFKTVEFRVHNYLKMLHLDSPEIMADFANLSKQIIEDYSIMVDLDAQKEKYMTWLNSQNFKNADYECMHQFCLNSLTCQNYLFQAQTIDLEHITNFLENASYFKEDSKERALFSQIAKIFTLLNGKETVSLIYEEDLKQQIWDKIAMLITLMISKATIYLKTALSAQKLSVEQANYLKAISLVWNIDWNDEKPIDYFNFAQNLANPTILNYYHFAYLLTYENVLEVFLNINKILSNKIIEKYPNITNNNFMFPSISAKWQLAKTLYLKKSKKIVFKRYVDLIVYYNLRYSLTDINLTEMNNLVVTTLLKESKYEIILNYLKILAKNKFSPDLMLLYASKIKMLDKQKNKQSLKELIAIFLSSKQIKLAICFLNELNIQNYLEYFPEDKKIGDYLNILEQQEHSEYHLLCQRILYFLNTNGDTLTKTKNWFLYLDKLVLTDEVILHKKYALISLLMEDFSLIKDTFIIKELNKLSSLTKNNSFLLNQLFILFVHRLLKQDNSLATKKAYLKQIEVLNCFIYQKEDVNLNSAFINLKNSNEKIEIKKIYKELLKKVTKEDIADFIDLYMNTYLKLVIPIEMLLKDLEPLQNENLYEYLNQYTFYGLFKRTQTIRFRITNVLNNDKTRVKLNQKIYYYAPYKVKIIGYNRFYNELRFRDFALLQENLAYENLQNIIVKQFDLVKTNQSLEKLKNTQNIFYRDYQNLNEQDIFKDLAYSSEIEKIKDKIGDLVFIETFLNNSYYTLEDKIAFYYLTSLKYFYDFHTYLLQLENMYVKEKILAHLKPYSFYFRSITENKIVANINLYSEQVFYRGLPIYILLIDDVTYFKAKIADFDNEKIYVQEILKTDVFTISNALRKFIQILSNYLEHDDFLELRQLINIGNIPEFSSVFTPITPKNINKINYLFKKIFIILIDDLEKLLLFLSYLGNKNIWVTAFNSAFFMDDTKDTIIKTYFNQFKTCKLRTILLCYQLSCLKDMIDYSEVWQRLLQVNDEAKALNNKDKIISLIPFNIKLTLKCREVKNDFYYMYVVDATKAFKVRIKATLDVGSTVSVILESYQSIYNIFEARVIKKQDVVIKKEEKNFYLDALFINKVFKKENKVDDIYELFLDAYFAKHNFFNSRTNIMDKKIAENYHALLQSIYKNFENYLSSIELSAETIEKLFYIYSHSILKVTISPYQFFRFFKDYLKQNDYRIKIPQKITIKILENLKNRCYKILFYTHEEVAIIKNTLNYEINTYHSVIVLGYDIRKRLFILE